MYDNSTKDGMDKLRVYYCKVLILCIKWYKILLTKFLNSLITPQLLWDKVGNKYQNSYLKINK